MLTWTNVDLPVVYNGATFSATGPLVQGLKYKASVGLEVDKQQITIAARPTDLINGAPVLIAIREGAFDGATVQRDRVFLTALGGTVIGGVTLFHGRVSTVDSVGRTQARRSRSRATSSCSTTICRGISIRRPACTRSTTPAAA